MTPDHVRVHRGSRRAPAGRAVALLVAVSIAGAGCGGSDDQIVQRQPEGAEATDVVPSVAAGSGEVTCPPEDGTDTVTREFPSEPPFCLDRDATYAAEVTTNLGSFTVDLDQDAAPVAVNNFVFLARNNYFDDTVCHRVIQDFVVQCGDPTGTGQGGPGYRFDDELPDPGEYEVGSLAMANSGPDTNGSQFFVISGPNGAALPPLYSLFGQVGDDDLPVVAEMNARGSLDDSGVASEEVRIVDVEITQTPAS